MKGWKRWDVLLRNPVVCGGVHYLVTSAVVREGDDECLWELEESCTFVYSREPTCTCGHAEEPGISNKTEFPGVSSTFLDELVSSGSESSECRELSGEGVEIWVRPEDISWKWLSLFWKRGRRLREWCHEVHTLPGGTSKLFGVHHYRFAKHVDKFVRYEVREGDDLLNQNPEWKSGVCLEKFKELFVVYTNTRFDGGA